MGGRPTLRRVAGLALAAALGAAVVVAALRDRLDLAVAALGLSSVLVLLALFQVWQRVARAERAAGSARRAARAAGEQARSLADVEKARHREVRAALAKERRAALARQRRLARRVAARQREVTRALQRQGKQLAKAQRDQTREVEALVQLFRDFTPRAPMPSSGNWALNPTDLLELLFVVDRERPGRVLELGSGTSSIWLGYALAKHAGRLVSVDHDREYAERTRAHLRRHGLDRVVEVREAPLRPVTVDAEAFEWYEVDAFVDLSDVDMLVVDGPPGAVGPRARYPALPVLHGRLSAHATVVLDDVDRPDEQDILGQWLAAVAGLVREPETIGHLAVLSYRRPPDPGRAPDPDPTPETGATTT